MVSKNYRKVSFDEICVCAMSPSSSFIASEMYQESTLGVHTLVGWAGDLTCGGLNPGGGALNGCGDASSSSTYNTKRGSMVTVVLTGTGHSMKFTRIKLF